MCEIDRQRWGIAMGLVPEDVHAGVATGAGGPYRSPQRPLSQPFRAPRRVTCQSVSHVRAGDGRGSWTGGGSQLIWRVGSCVGRNTRATPRFGCVTGHGWKWTSEQVRLRLDRSPSRRRVHRSGRDRIRDRLGRQPTGCRHLPRRGVLHPGRHLSGLWLRHLRRCPDHLDRRRWLSPCSDHVVQPGRRPGLDHRVRRPGGALWRGLCRCLQPGRCHQLHGSCRRRRSRCFPRIGAARCGLRCSGSSHHCRSRLRDRCRPLRGGPIRGRPRQRWTPPAPSTSTLRT